jgi:type II secretory pathway component HofQ
MRSFQLICGLTLVFGLSAIARAEGEFKLPAPGKSVSIEVLIANFSTAAGTEPGTPTAEKILELEKQGKLASSTRVQLATLDMQSARVQYGESVPVPTGATIRGGGGPPAVSYRYTETGTIVEATPRVEEDGSVVLLLSVQETRLVPGSKAGAEKEEAGGFTPTKTAMMTAKTTLRVPAGKSVVTGGQRSDKDPSQTWIVISAKVLEAK